MLTAGRATPILLVLLAALVLLYCSVGLILYFQQRSLIYLPVARIAHPYPVEHVRSGGETLEVVVLNPGKQDGVLYFGGNAEQVVANSPGFLQHFPAHSVYLVNYRGYAGSTGKPTEQGLYEDARSVFDAIEGRHDRLSVIGRSLGSAVATYLASVRPVHRMMLVTPFDSILHMAQDLYPYFPVTLLLKDRFDSFVRVRDISARTLVLTAEHDQIVRAKYSKRLLSAFPASQVTHRTIPGTGHNGLAAAPDYFSLLGGFVASP